MSFLKLLLNTPRHTRSWPFRWMSTVQANINKESRNLVVKDTKSPDSQLMFPFPWLRYNCQCSECFHTVTKTRMMLIQDLDPDVIPKDVHVSIVFKGPKSPLTVIRFSRLSLDTGSIRIATFICYNKYVYEGSQLNTI